MRVAAIFDIGTGNYPEKVGRRLRATTVTAWLIALSMLLFMFASPGKPHPVTLIVLIGSACVPLLHRFGPTVGPLVLIGLAWLHAVRVILTIGTGDGIFLGFLSAAPLSILLFGIERLWIAGALSVLSTGICIYLFHIMPPDTGVNPAEIMRWQFTINYVLNAAVLFCVVAYVVRTAARAEEAVEGERRRSDALLANILPPSIALRLKAAPREMIADRYDAVSVLFADMAGSTAMASRIDPSVLVDFLNRIFTLIDDLVARHGLEKIKTTGDSYMVVSGIPEPRPDHAFVLAALALDMREAISCRRAPTARMFRFASALPPVRSWPASSAGRNSSTMSGATL